jgi:hypothetical protein
MKPGNGCRREDEAAPAAQAIQRLPGAFARSMRSLDRSPAVAGRSH